NDDNLIPANKRSESERREIAKKGGIASGKSRRRKKELKTIIEQALNSVIPNEKAQKKLESLGFDPTFQSAIALKVVEQAMNGNLRAVELISNISFAGKDALDKKEQRERIKSLQLENDKKQLTLSDDDKTENTLAEYFSKLDEALDK
ncbi:TPA: stress-induced protein, partial [Streptococcus pyogenes]